MSLNKELSKNREPRVAIKKRGKTMARKAKLIETRIFEIEASGPFCVLPPYFFERSLELASRADSEAASRKAGLVFEGLRTRTRQ